MTAPESEKIAVIIEDDADVRHLLKTVLTQSGFQTILTSNGEDGVEAVRAYEPLLTTLDVSMPGMDGFAAAKRIREFSSTYIVMLTALGEEIDIVQGLDSGADDYLLKPFRPRELRARVETMLRRPRARSGVLVGAGRSDVPTSIDFPPRAPEALVTPAAPPVVHEAERPTVVPEPVAAPAPQVHRTAPAVAASTRQAPVHQPSAPVPAQPPAAADGGATDGWMEHRGLELNPHTRSTRVDGTPVELTRSEFDLMAALLSSGRRVRSKADLVLTLRGESYVTTYYVNDADKRAIEVHMANLRRKIGDSTTSPRFIETVRGVGYRLASDRD